MATAKTVEASTYGFFLAGKWVSEGKPMEVIAPHDGRVIATVHQATHAHVERAISAAVDTFETTRKLPAHERQRILRAIAEGLTARREEFARTLALEAAKPIKLARIETDRAIFTFQVAAEEATRVGGEYLPLDLQASTAGRWGLLRRFPIGPVAAITPFNFPLNLVAHKFAPAIAAGCTLVHKPGPQTPLCALLLAELVEQAGWPAGALSVLPLDVPDAEPLVTDERIKLLTFTGSARVGWDLKRRAGKKRVALELGGNAGCIIHDDADLDYAAERTVFGGFSYAGQSCISVQRVLVHRNAHAKFLSVLLPRVQALTMGDILEEATDVGPLIAESAARRAEEWVGEAAAAGAKVLCGGKRNGSFFAPTVLTGTRSNQRVNCEEIFAPVITVEPYDDFDAVLAEVNRTPYGLQAGVFTRDVKRIFRAYEILDVGAVIAGDVPSFRIDHMPYGGVKDSGAGREGVRYAIEEMTEPKLLVMNLR